MKNKKKIRKMAAVLVMSGMLLNMSAVNSEAAVITSNATDKVAAVFNESTAYSAGDYVVYDGELYICMGEVQGAWSEVRIAFMQITKNHEIGQSDELSASYRASKDPSEETSLLAFVANAWQKVKLFFGMDSKDAETDADNYKDASISAKLNYLEEQGSTLQESVNRSFQSVSNGKSKLSDAITDGGGTASPQYSFAQFSSAITALSRQQYNNGKTQGAADATAQVNKNSESYKQGVADATAQVNRDSESYKQGVTDAMAQVNKNSESYKQGVADATAQVNRNSESYKQGVADATAQVNRNSESYRQGVADAATQVNKSSESYRQGVADGELKKYTMKIRLDYHGADKEQDCWVSYPGTYGNFKMWRFTKKFTGHKIFAVNADQMSHSNYNSGRNWQMALFVGEKYLKVTGRNDDYGNGGSIGVTEDTFTWGDFGFNSLNGNEVWSDVEITIFYY